jgi:hypothetical protein
LLQAVLMLFVVLVQGAAATLGMVFNRTRGDWRMERANADLPEATSGNHLQ